MHSIHIMKWNIIIQVRCQLYPVYHFLRAFKLQGLCRHVPLAFASTLWWQLPSHEQTHLCQNTQQRFVDKSVHLLLNRIFIFIVNRYKGKIYTKSVHYISINRSCLESVLPHCMRWDRGLFSWHNNMNHQWINFFSTGCQLLASLCGRWTTAVGIQNSIIRVEVSLFKGLACPKISEWFGWKSQV